MKIKAALIISIILGSLAIVVWDMNKKPKIYGVVESISTPLQIDRDQFKSVPKVEFTDLQGNKVSLEHFKGKVVLLNFWATWCPQCVSEFPHFTELIKKYNGRIIWLAVSNDDNKQVLQDFLEKQQGLIGGILADQSMVVVWDENNKITSGIFYTELFPETIIVTKDTLMADKIVGPADWGSEEMGQYLNALLSEEQ